MCEVANAEAAGACTRTQPRSNFLFTAPHSALPHKNSRRKRRHNDLELHPLLTTSTHTAFTMRPLTEPETKVLFEKLATYCGKGISNLIADPAGGNDRNVFRVQVCSLPASLPLPLE
jgi:hypothetical protein